jgi:hypothetical protein
MEKLIRFTACLAGLGILGGCSAEPVYTYVQHEDGLAMKAPITFTVRVSVDKSKKSVAWVQDAVDVNGVSDRQLRTYGEAPFSPCEIFDDENWRCELRSGDGKLAERPQMKDGNLSRFYWTSTENYSRSLRLRHVF